MLLASGGGKQSCYFVLKKHMRLWGRRKEVEESKVNKATPAVKRVAFKRKASSKLGDPPSLQKNLSISMEMGGIGGKDREAGESHRGERRTLSKRSRKRNSPDLSSLRGTPSHRKAECPANKSSRKSSWGRDWPTQSGSGGRDSRDRIMCLVVDDWENMRSKEREGRYS